ncbi:MAG: YdcF family protein [Epsilonproteobacteria bacterium]|nr:YdcF family protein [Campylobacterota bacterium]
MDFLLKKFISLFIMPFPLGMILLLIGIVLLFRNKRIKASFVLSLSFLWLFVISYSPFANAYLYQYENTYPALQQAPQDIAYIYVLGRGHHTDASQPITSQNHEVSVVRLSEAIRLYHQLKEQPTIIVSGYSGLYDPTTGAQMQKELAIALGVKAENLHLEPQAKDTQEEAEAEKKYIGSKPFILVTSASHMPRAIQFFKHEGLMPIAAPTNHLAQIKHTHYTNFFDVRALRKTDMAWHEMLGLLWQKIKGIS